MQIRQLNQEELSDFRRLVEIFKEVFESEVPIADNQQLSKLLAHPDFRVFVVKQGNEVAGGLTLYVLHQYYNTRPLAYLYDVAIAPAYQGQGLGKQLMAEVCNYCRANGFEAAYAEAESDDIDAVEFYRKTTYSSAMNAIHFTYDF